MFFFILFICFWLCWVFIAKQWVSLVAANRSYSLVAVPGLFMVEVSLVAEHGLEIAWTQQLWYMGLAAPQHVGSSQTRDPTCVPCIGRGILNPWTTYQVKSWSNHIDLLLLIYFLISFNLTQFLLSTKIVSIWVIKMIPSILFT